jgi:hypothetical protein
MKRPINTLAIAAWIAVVAIAYATLTHVGLVYGIYFKLLPYLRYPAMRTYAHFEHIIAFFFLGILFAFAYPRRPIPVCCTVFGAASLLELLQTITPDRHGTLLMHLRRLRAAPLEFCLRGLSRPAVSDQEVTQNDAHCRAAW